MSKPASNLLLSATSLRALDCVIVIFDSIVGFGTGQHSQLESQSTTFNIVNPSPSAMPSSYYTVYTGSLHDMPANEDLFDTQTKAPQHDEGLLCCEI